jgi:hypothetical protein
MPKRKEKTVDLEPGTASAGAGVTTAKRVKSSDGGKGEDLTVSGARQTTKNNGTNERQVDASIIDGDEHEAEYGDDDYDSVIISTRDEYDDDAEDDDNDGDEDNGDYDDREGDDDESTPTPSNSEGGKGGSAPSGAASGPTPQGQSRVIRPRVRYGWDGKQAEKPRRLA